MIDEPPNVPGSPVGTTSGFRFGLGFALGALVILAAAWLALLVLRNPGGEVSLDLNLGSQPSAVFSGSGSATSEPFHLGGNVDVDWTARPIESTGCRMRAVLRVDTRGSEYQVLVDGETAMEVNRTQSLDKLVSNNYVIEVDSTCDWSFSFKSRS